MWRFLWDIGPLKQPGATRPQEGIHPLLGPLPSLPGIKITRVAVGPTCIGYEKPRRQSGRMCKTISAPRRLGPQPRRDREGLRDAVARGLTQVTGARAKASQIKGDASTVTDPVKFKEYQDAQNALTGALGQM